MLCLIISVLLSVLVLKGQDTIVSGSKTILCKITKVTSMNVFYTENKVGKSISLKEVSYYSKPTVTIAKQDSVPVFMNGPLITLGITTQTFDHNRPGVSYDRYNVHSRSFITHFYVDTAKYPIKFGGLNMKPFLKNDPQALRALNCYTAGNIIVAVGIAGLLTTVGIVKFGDPKSEDPYSISGAASVGVIIFGAIMSNLSIKKTVKTYNKHNGHGKVY